MSKTAKMSRTGKIILVVLLCLVVLGTVAGVVAWTQSDKFDQKELSYVGKYEVGGLDSAGNYMSTNASIYTKKPIECQGLNCNLIFDNSISYQLYFYDQDNEFVHTTGKLTGTFSEEGVPFFAKYVRIAITPNDDDKVTSLEVNKYAKQLKIKVNREQGFKNYTDNLFEIEFTNKTLDDKGAVVDVEGGVTRNVSRFINLQGYKEMMIFRIYSTVPELDKVWIHLYDVNKNYVKQIRVMDNASVVFTSSEGVVYYSLDLSLYNEDNVGYMRMMCNEITTIEIYCR